MTVIQQNSGAVLVKVAYGGGSLVSLGYAEDQTEPAINPFWHNVPGDQRGGIDGPPIDIQLLGATALIRLALSSWDATVAAQITAFTGTASVGTLPTPGTFIFANNLHYRVCLVCASNPLNFPVCIPRGSVVIGKGTKYSRFICEFEAHMDASFVLFNTSTAG